LRTLVEPYHTKNIQTPHLYYLKKANFIHQTVKQITKHRVTLQSGDQVSYDYLLLCTGASYMIPKGIKRDNIVSARVDQLNSYFKRLQVPSVKAILIIGAGTVGVELAAELISTFPEKEIILVGPLLARCPQRAVQYALKWLETNGIKIISNEKVVSFEGNTFLCSLGTKITADFTFIANGNIPNTQFIKSSELSSVVNEMGYIRVNKYLQVEGTDNIYAAGDIADIPGEEEKLCQGAIWEADVVAKNIICSESGKPLKDYSASCLPMLISLGKYDCILTYRGFTISGFIPALMKEFVEWKEMLKFKESYDLVSSPKHDDSNLHIV